MLLRRAAGLFVVAWMGACGGSGGRDDDFGMPCTPGTTIGCMCPTGGDRIATCGADGVFGPCPCDGGTGTVGDGGTSAAATGDSGACTDACTSGADTGATTGCVDGPRFAGLVDGISLPWTEGGQMGLAAGELKCQGIGADHLCDYEEVKAAALAEELAQLGVGTSGWIHRTTIETVAGRPSAPGPGGRCIDWTYAMDMLADGEYVEITADGPVFVLDPDTFYDGLDPSHADPTDLPCAGIARALLCCNAACE
jgi:hypothetical protein